MRTLTETAAAIGDKVSEARESVEDMARAAGTKLEAGRDDTVDGLRTAATSVRSTGRQGSEAIDRIAKSTANKLDSTATYLEDSNLKDMFVGARQFGRRHLTGSLVAAAAIGFLASTALRRMTHTRARPIEG